MGRFICAKHDTLWQRARLTKGISLIDLSNLLEMNHGVSIPHRRLSDWFNGRTTVSDHKSRAAVCIELNISMSDAHDFDLEAQATYKIRRAQNDQTVKMSGFSEEYYDTEVGLLFLARLNENKMSLHDLAESLDIRVEYLREYMRCVRIPYSDMNKITSWLGVTSSYYIEIYQNSQDIVMAREHISHEVSGTRSSYKSGSTPNEKTYLSFDQIIVPEAAFAVLEQFFINNKDSACTKLLDAAYQELYGACEPTEHMRIINNLPKMRACELVELGKQYPQTNLLMAINEYLNCLLVG